jgi:hypothetical protein
MMTEILVFIWTNMPTDSNKAVSGRKFKGTSSEYTSLHNRIRVQIPKPTKCQFCRKVRRLDLANKSQKYKDDITDWLYLCRTCHRRWDSYKYKRIDEKWHKVCTKCKILYPETEFYGRNSKVIAYGKVCDRTDTQGWCKGCTTKYVKKKLPENIEERRAYWRWQWKNRESYNIRHNLTNPTH